MNFIIILETPNYAMAVFRHIFKPESVSNICIHNLHYIITLLYTVTRYETVSIFCIHSICEYKNIYYVNYIYTYI